ncbi:hypothetical protein BU26DRAFT_184555 [Trematosphaeria pertusa]|uniref:Uncharacterized protein n=1 Tax=Trematosphaeria pertusa TaxID=390896 RepID=A0A6A6HT30_9PLEO|nr:uncharacterized protein BU26DRAFT_184555 [Trematosphaeria pertusa]KAF2240928.1 hypothetical protein BU26DRAFT_184555 [Trematosphaeria pertusa]
MVNDERVGRRRSQSDDIDRQDAVSDSGTRAPIAAANPRQRISPRPPVPSASAEPAQDTARRLDARSLPAVLEDSNAGGSWSQSRRRSHSPPIRRKLALSPHIASIHERLQTRIDSVRADAPHPDRLRRELTERFVRDRNGVRRVDHEFKVDTLSEERKHPWERNQDGHGLQHRRDKNGQIRAYKQRARGASGDEELDNDARIRLSAEDLEALEIGENGMELNGTLLQTEADDTSPRPATERASRDATNPIPTISIDGRSLQGSESLPPQPQAVHISGGRSPSYDARDSSPSHRGPSHLPAHVSAFEYAMSPFLRAHPRYLACLQPPSPSSESSFTFGPASPRRRPPDPDEISVNTDELRPSTPPADGIPPIVEHKKSLRVRIKVLRIRVALMRCAVLARAAWELEHNPWKSETAVYREYSKMGKIADGALDLARELKSDGLQARCLYWKGRACGGKRYWDEAVPAFRQAELLDTREDDAGEGEAQCRLTRTERQDLKFLLESAKARAENEKEERELRYRRDEERAWQRADLLGRGFEEVVQWSRSPPWHPDMERIMQGWMAERGGHGQEEGADVANSGGEDEEAGGIVWNAEAQEQWVLRPLTREERWYIENGGRISKRMGKRDPRAMDDRDSTGLGVADVCVKP